MAKSGKPKKEKPASMVWACPNCGAVAGKHGKGGKDDCASSFASCDGLICECWEYGGEQGELSEKKNHGISTENPCLNAVCHHCEWGGELPKRPFDPEKLKGWAKIAWAEGWRPPEGWQPGRR